LTKQGGQGILVPGGYILTAAHCVDWSGTGGMALGDYFVEPVKTRDGRTFRANVDVAEPVSDVAALGLPDSQELGEDYEAFEEFALATKPVPLCTRIPAVDQSFPVQVPTHKGKWITGKVIRYGIPGTPPGSRITLEANSKIEGGTSGGPVVDAVGRLVGVVSCSGEKVDFTGHYSGMIPVASLALPRWILNRILGNGQQNSKVTRKGKG
jgi:hypothetical protein